jgi:amino acid adenylation domain-containing protein
MLYTSGSTGRPKGAIVRHDGAVNHLFAQVHALGRETVARFLQSAPASSDISVWQFAAPLALGGTTVIVDDATDVARLLVEVQRHELHLVELVPTVFKYLVDYAAALPAGERALPSLRYAMVTGEAASVALVNAWLALYPAIPVVNAYGPTEAADDISQAVIRRPLPPRQATVPIGPPLANLDLHVLDARLRPLPVGAWGEIGVAGISVGDGYWRQPEKTAAAFVANPFAGLPGAAGPVLYRTGDIGRWRDDGSLECAGRIDHQVQFRGQRIELAEIEVVLREHAGVADAVAQVFHGGPDGDDAGRLVAFVVPRAACAGDEGDEGHEGHESAWRSHLAARLPSAMLPSAFVTLGALPLNPAGKVDRSALRPPAPAPSGNGSGNGHRGPRRAARSAVERMLLRLWAQELAAPEIGIDEDFFALGGDSMSALAIAVGAREAGWQLRSADVLAHPTIARLATVAQAVAAPAAHPSHADRSADPGDDSPRALRPLDEALRRRFLAAQPAWADVQPLTPPQQGLLVHWLLARDKRAYVDQLCYALDGALHAPAFRAAWQAVVDRHPALRAGFLRSALPQPVQVTARSAPLPWTELDLSALDAAGQAAAWQAHCAREVDAGFDLACPPLMRLTLARLGADRHALAWTHHHLLLDGWSVAGVLREVLAVHAAGGDVAQADLPALTTDAPYRDYLVRADLRAGLQHWQRELSGVAGAPPWNLPVRPDTAPGYGELELELAPPATAALAARAAACGVTLGTLLQAAWALLVARHTGHDELVLGVVGSGRELPVPGIERMPGLFVVTQPLRVDTRRGQPLRAWLAALQATAAAGRAHEALPLAAAVRAAALPPDQALFETLFVLWNFPTLQEAPAGPLAIRPTQYRTVPAYPLSLITVPGPALQLRLVHERQRFDAAAAATLRKTLQQLLESLARGEDPRSARAPVE